MKYITIFLCGCSSNCGFYDTGINIAAMSQIILSLVGSNHHVCQRIGNEMGIVGIHTIIELVQYLV